MLDVGAPGRLRFRLLGQPSIASGDPGSVRISAQKGLALLAYLAMHQGAAVNRAIVADLLWSDRVDTQARQNLRQLILTLRRDLGPRHVALLQTDDQSISLATDATDVDAVQFEAWAKNPDPAVRARCLELAWGSFLDGFSIGAEAFDEWVVAERHRLDVIATRVFSDLARQFDAAGDGERAILAFERLIAIDPGEEERHRRLLVLEARYRGADAALARGKALAALLKRELDAELEPATVALLEDIRRKGEMAADVDVQLGRSASERPAPQVETDGRPARNEKPVGPSSWLRWLPGQTLLGTHRAALVAGLVLVTACAALLWIVAAKWPQDRTAIVAAAPDSWQSPSLPSGRKIDATGPRRGVIPIIVLPFKAYEDAESTRMLAEMMTDDLINTLSRVHYFRLVSRQTARSYQMQQIDVATLGKELDVRYAIEGSVRRHGTALRVAVELIDTATRKVVWSTRIDREEADRHLVQDEIVSRLARELQVGSFPVESARRSSDPDADALVFRGFAALFAAFADMRLEAYDKAQALFLEALQRDPQSPGARLGLGSYHAHVAGNGLVPDGNAHLDKAIEILAAVIRDRPSISGAHFQLGIALQNRGQLAEAIESFERALELNPSQAGAYANLGFALTLSGRAKEGLEHSRYAMRLGPRDPVLPIWQQHAGSAELELGNDQQAIDYFRRSVGSSPAYTRSWAGLAAAQALAGDIDAARGAAERLRALVPDLTAQELFRRFGRLNTKSARLQEGLWRALTAPAPTIEKSWQSPPLPSGRSGGGPDQRRGVIPIVVMPIKIYEDAASVRTMADMMTDDLTNMLSRVRPFRVVSRQTARLYSTRQIDVADAGRELGVRYALEGSVRIHGDKLRVSVELTDTASRIVVWATQVEREDVDRHVVLDEIVRRLVRELHIGSYPIESARRSNDPDADALSYRGMAALHVAVSKLTLEAYDQAMALFAEALKRDPQNVMARLGMGGYHAYVAVQRLVPDVDNHLNKALEITTAVIRERPDISGAHYRLGVILQTRGKLKEAIESFERALELNPSNAASHAGIGFALARMGRAGEGIEHIRYAMRLSPKDPALAIWLEFAGAAELELGHYQDAIENFRRSIAMAPTYPRPWAGLVAAQALAGDIEAARRSVDQLRKSSPNLTAQQLYQRFARLSSQSLRLQEGLRRALLEGDGPPATQRSWQSPAQPSQTARDPIARERGLVAIAVLPFRSYGENGDSKTVVADMVTDDLTYLLSRVSVFRVISNQTAASYRGQNIDVAAIGAELGVHYLVEGTVSTRENILTVTVALVDATTRLQIWSRRFERAGQDRPAMQREIVNSLARELQVSAVTFENGRISNDPDVHELIFKGFAAIQASRLNGVEGLRPSEAYFRKALERDPDAVRAQIGLGAFHAHMAVQLFAPDPAPHLTKAEAILQQVINRHPNVSEAYPPMGLVHVARGDMDKAAQTFERAIELNPSDAPSHAQYGRALVSLGRAQAGLEHIRYAMQLSPRDPVLGYWLAFAGYAYLELNRYDEAINHLGRAHATNPTQPRTALTLVAALAMAGRMNEAGLKLEQLQQTHPHLTRDKIAKMYSGMNGRLQSREGIRRVLSVESTDHSGATK